MEQSKGDELHGANEDELRSMKQRHLNGSGIAWREVWSRGRGLGKRERNLGCKSERMKSVFYTHDGGRWKRQTWLRAWITDRGHHLARVWGNACETSDRVALGMND